MTPSDLLNGYTREQLSQAFSAIQHPQNWKLGHVARVKLSDLPVTEYAVIFFTGGPLVTVSRDTNSGFAWVAFEGYYHHVGA